MENTLIIQLYKAIVRPHVEYCIQVWRPYHKKDFDELESVQFNGGQLNLVHNLNNYAMKDAC